MKSTISAPLIITPRLMPGASIGGGFLSIEYSPRLGDNGRTRYRYALDVDGREYEADDLQSGVGGGSLQEGLSSLLSFLLHSAEEYDAFTRSGRRDDSDTFPEWVAEWAYTHSEELEILAMDLEEPGVIVEGI